MLQAFETFEMGLCQERIIPRDLGGPFGDHINMSDVSSYNESQFNLFLSVLDVTSIRDI